MGGSAKKTEAEKISFLISCLEHCDNMDFDAVANRTGLYKSGKFVRQYLTSVKKEYGSATMEEAGEGKWPGNAKLGFDAVEHGVTPVTPSKRKAGETGGAKKKRKAKTETEDEDANSEPETVVKEGDDEA